MLFKAGSELPYVRSDPPPCRTFPGKSLDGRPPQAAIWLRRARNNKSKTKLLVTKHNRFNGSDYFFREESLIGPKEVRNNKIR